MQEHIIEKNGTIPVLDKEILKTKNFTKAEKSLVSGFIDGIKAAKSLTHQDDLSDEDNQVK